MLGAPGFGDLLLFLSAGKLQISSVSRDVHLGSRPGFGEVTQGRSETCPKAIPALFVLAVFQVTVLSGKKSITQYLSLLLGW